MLEEDGEDSQGSSSSAESSEEAEVRRLYHRSAAFLPAASSTSTARDHRLRTQEWRAGDGRAASLARAALRAQG